MVSFIRNGRFLDPADQWVYGDLTINDGEVVRITEGPDVEALIADDTDIVLDAEGNRVGPGFIDLQINGGFGIDLQSDPAAVWQLGERLPSIGVTAFLPTLTTNGHAHVAEALAALERRPVDYVGAEPLGWHLEGPWLSEAKRGAHARSKLEPIPDELPDWYAPEHGVALVTLDPELPGAERAVATLVDRGVVVSFGHTAAAQPFADLAYGWGATMGTHLFNAMVGLHHRDPGLAATLLSERCSAFFGLIVDGEHVAPPLVDIAWRLAPDRLVLVSDAVAPLGMTEQRVHRLDDGTLAGAVAGLDAGVRNLAAFTGCSTGAAHRAASARPADVLVDQTRGELWPGLRADAVVLDDDGRVAATIIGGELVYRADD
ncbi:MAG: hypothetical protein R2733_25815 [Acidimicrobiales bacterium]